ncbi:hypothetical protein FIM05_01510 [SAR202 cluster bacterium AD-802-K11_MRT_200m]|nr:hypothetical protein [SAR202 cluster bacterium AD-802-K11_MRT_200m]
MNCRENDNPYTIQNMRLRDRIERGWPMGKTPDKSLNILIHLFFWSATVLAYIGAVSLFRYFDTETYLYTDGWNAFLYYLQVIAQGWAFLLMLGMFAIPLFFFTAISQLRECQSEFRKYRNGQGIYFQRYEGEEDD